MFPLDAHLMVGCVSCCYVTHTHSGLAENVTVDGRTGIPQREQAGLQGRFGGLYVVGYKRYLLAAFARTTSKYISTATHFLQYQNGQGTI